MKKTHIFFGLLLVVLYQFTQSASAEAPLFETKAKQAILIDLLSGQTLYAKAADAQIAPASMTKMMTIYLIFERLSRNIIDLEDLYLVSEKAWRMGGSKMFVEVGKQVRLKDLLYGIIVQSGNDATIVIAEALAGSEAAFAELMSAKARELGMNNTQFKNASGWPDEGHYSTARDLAILASATINNFPELYKIYAEKEFTYSGIRQFNRNPILGRIQGVDGIKTGHVEASGYGFAGSAIRAGRRMIFIVHGLESQTERREASTSILEWGYTNWGYYRYYSKGTRLTEFPVWLGEKTQVQAVLADHVAFSIPRNDANHLEFHIAATTPITAPITLNQPIGELQLKMYGQIIKTYPLLASEPIAPLSAFNRLGAALKFMLFGE